MKLVGIVGALVLILALALPAYAETQSVKVSGDLTVRGIFRKDFDLNQNGQPNRENFAMTTTEVQIDADLTDNVSTVIRIVNQRNWGDSDYKFYRDANGQNQWTFGHGLLDLGIDLAYIQIKEFFFQPVSIRIGRQDLWFGRGLIIAANQVDPGRTAIWHNGVNLGTIRGIGSPELTAYNAFDAVRTTIDFEQYAPFVVDLVYFKNDEGDIAGGDDIDMYGINAGYTWDVYNAEAEAYYWLKDDHSAGNTHDNSIHLLGIRGSFMPNEEFVFGAEAAGQFGDFVANNGQDNPRNREAYMLNAFVDYLGWTKYMYSPKLGAEWIFTTGDHNVGQAGGEMSQWDPLYRGYYPLLIRPFQGLYYITARFPGGEDLGITNQHEFILKGSIQPLDDLTFEATVAKYYFDQTPVRAGEFGPSGGNDIGSEIDLMTTYDYTEDVTFSLLTAWFFPGDVYDNQKMLAYPNTSNQDLQPGIASEVIGSCKVSF